MKKKKLFCYIQVEVVCRVRHLVTRKHHHSCHRVAVTEVRHQVQTLNQSHDQGGCFISFLFNISTVIYTHDPVSHDCHSQMFITDLHAYLDSLFPVYSKSFPYLRPLSFFFLFSGGFVVLDYDQINLSILPLTRASFALISFLKSSNLLSYAIDTFIHKRIKVACWLFKG
jgi:hypothetical protein